MPTNYMQDHFGVSAAQASGSGYERYTPDSGLRDLTVSIGLQYQISREWMLFTRLKSTALSNAAEDSSLVRKASSPSGFDALAYSF